MDVENFFVFHDLVVQVGFENSSYLVAEDASSPGPTQLSSLAVHKSRESLVSFLTVSMT